MERAEEIRLIPSPLFVGTPETVATLQTRLEELGLASSWVLQLDLSPVSEPLLTTPLTEGMVKLFAAELRRL